MNDEPSTDDASDLELADEATDDSPVPDEVMTGTEQWWEFLDKKGDSDLGPHLPGERGGQEDGGTELEIEDVSGPQHTGGGLRPSAHSFRCSNCRGENPSDFPFCVHCGSRPNQPLHRRTALFVLEEVADGEARRYLARVFAAGTERLGGERIDRLLEDPPAFLLVDGYPRQLDSLLERLDELGVQVRTVSPTDPALPWHREIAESILRDTNELFIFGLIAVATLLATFALTPWLLPLGLAALWWRFRRRRDWYQDQFRLEITPMLAAVSGLDPDLADRTRRLLRRLEGTDVQQSLATCLMEYYAIWHRLAPTPDSVRSRLHREARTLAREIIDQVVRCGEDYAEIASILDRHGDALEAEAADDEHLAQLMEAEPKLRRQLATMADSLESLRTRTVALETHPDRTGSRLDEAMSAIEDELAVVSETVGALTSDIEV